MLKKAGFIILSIGVLLSIYSGFIHFTKEKGVDVEKTGTTQDNQDVVLWPPYAGIGTMIIGGVVLVLGINRKDEKEIVHDLK